MTSQVQSTSRSSVSAPASERNAPAAAGACANRLYLRVAGSAAGRSRTKSARSRTKSFLQPRGRSVGRAAAAAGRARRRGPRRGEIHVGSGPPFFFAARERTRSTAAAAVAVRRGLRGLRSHREAPSSSGAAPGSASSRWGNLETRLTDHRVRVPSGPSPCSLARRYASPFLFFWKGGERAFESRRRELAGALRAARAGQSWGKS